jgi:hypothetical protein
MAPMIVASPMQTEQIARQWQLFNTTFFIFTQTFTELALQKLYNYTFDSYSSAILIFSSTRYL